MNVPNSVLLSHLRSLSAARQNTAGSQSEPAVHSNLGGSTAHVPRQMDIRLTSPLQQLNAAYQLLGYNAQSVPHGNNQTVIVPHGPHGTEIPSLLSVAPVQSLPSVPSIAPSIPSMSAFGSILEQPTVLAATDISSSSAQIDKKILKRAANRKSAQLSRKRKKAFVDDLKAENENLKRNKDILDCIPDLVFAFDALSGKIAFASNSVYQCLQVPTSRLLDLSIFNLITENSGQKLKDMLDKVCNMGPRSELRIDLPRRIDLCFLTKYMTRVWGELDGVVQFKDDQVECICSFRPAARNPMLMSGFGPVSRHDDHESGGSEDTRISSVTSVADESCSTSSSYSHSQEGDAQSQEDSDDNPNGRSTNSQRTAAQNSTQTNILSHQRLRQNMGNPGNDAQPCSMTRRPEEGSDSDENHGRNA